MQVIATNHAKTAHPGIRLVDFFDWMYIHLPMIAEGNLGLAPSGAKSDSSFDGGNPAALGSSLEDITDETYDELRALAARYLGRERAEHTLQPTALVHEAFLRILKQNEMSWTGGRAHLVAFAARAMRRILITYGVARARAKRGGPNSIRLPLDEAFAFCESRELDLSAVDEALKNLQRVDARRAQIVEMRFFAGLTVEEIAAALQISPATVKRDWASAKLWLRCELCSFE
jgi:RNA polymerase sigma factor (TIGR02999 family)